MFHFLSLTWISFSWLVTQRAPPEPTKTQMEADQQNSLAWKFDLLQFENNSQALTNCSIKKTQKNSHSWNLALYLRNSPIRIKREGQDGPWTWFTSLSMFRQASGAQKCLLMWWLYKIHFYLFCLRFVMLCLLSAYRAKEKQKPDQKSVHFLWALNVMCQNSHWTLARLLIEFRVWPPQSFDLNYPEGMSSAGLSESWHVLCKQPMLRTQEWLTNSLKKICITKQHIGWR